MGEIGGRAVSISQQGEQLFCEGAHPSHIRRFFSLGSDLKAIAAEIDQDEVIHRALDRYRGLRVIRQEPWECLASFILSSFNNIPRLTGMIERLCLHFGDPRRGTTARSAGFADTLSGPQRGPALALALTPGSNPKENEDRATFALRDGLLTPQTSGRSRGVETYKFPRAEALARVSEKTLRNCGLGFRAPYLKAAARMVSSGQAPLEEWERLDDEALRRSLRAIPGVGEKVVECVMLFAYGRASAFPVDVWIGRAMRRWYFRGAQANDRTIRDFAREHFGAYCGWAQQYLYCLARDDAESLRTSLEETVPSPRIS